MSESSDAFDRFQSLYRNERYDEVLAALKELESTRSLEPRELVLRGRAILLSESSAYELADAEVAFRQALERDSTCVQALLELGWFYYSTHDDPVTAQPLFQSALEIAQDEFAEAAAGTLRCVAENRSPAEALAMKAEIQAHALDSELVENVVADYSTLKE